MRYEKTFGYDSGGTYVEIYTDDDGASGNGDNPMVGRWYGPRDECLKLDPATVPLHPLRLDNSPDPFDLACERRHD